MTGKLASKVDQRLAAGEFKPSANRPDRWGAPCGAITRHNHENNNGNCQLTAGFGTDHLGQGRCKFHGGSTPRNSGRYSRLKDSSTIKKLVEEHELDPEPLNLLPDLALARAMLEEYIDTMDSRWAVLTKWADADPSDGARPTVLPPDLGEARKLLHMIGGLVKKVADIKAQGGVSTPDFVRVMNEFGRIVKANVSNPDERDAIAKGWQRVMLTPM